jgi:hypothetical protein
MNPSDYMVQQHIADLRRVAAQQRLARQARAYPVGDQPNIVARWLNRLSAMLRRQEHRRQPELEPAPRAALNRPLRSVNAKPCATLPELCIDEAWC